MVAAQLSRSRPRAELPAETLVNSVQEVMRLVFHQLHPTLEAEGISKGEFWALHLVSSLESASVSSVARHLSVSAPTVCANVDQLEAAGLVRRQRSSRDRREVEISLTPKGRRVEARVWSEISRTLVRAAAAIPTEDLATAANVFRELAEGLVRSPPAPGGRP